MIEFVSQWFTLYYLTLTWLLCYMLGPIYIWFPSYSNVEESKCIKSSNFRQVLQKKKIRKFTYSQRYIKQVKQNKFGMENGKQKRTSILYIYFCNHKMNKKTDHYISIQIVPFPSSNPSLKSLFTKTNFKRFKLSLNIIWNSTVLWHLIQ